MHIRLLILSTLVFGGIITPLQAAEIRLNGSNAITDVVLQLHLSEIQDRSGQKLLITESDSNHGIFDLTQDIAQIAMTSKSLDKAVEEINSDSPIEVTSNGLQAHKVAEAHISFAVHKSNAVTELTLKQIEDIFTGQISNWSELGGTDQPIVIFMEKPGGPLRALLEEELIKDKRIEATTREFMNVAQIPGFVRATPNALGVISSAYMREELEEIATDGPIKQDLFFVTKGEPSTEVLAVIDAVKSVSGIQ